MELSKWIKAKMLPMSGIPDIFANLPFQATRTKHSGTLTWPSRPTLTTLISTTTVAKVSSTLPVSRFHS